MPALRKMRSSGALVERDNCAATNCSFSLIDKVVNKTYRLGLMYHGARELLVARGRLASRRISTTCR